MGHHAVDDHVGAEGQALDLGRDLVGAVAVGFQDGHHVDEQRLVDRRGLAADRGQRADVGGAADVDREQLLDLGLAAVAQAIAVALVDDELVIV